MRTLLCAALIVAACAPGERTATPAGSAATGPAQQYAGTWEGRSYRSASDTGIPFRIVSSVAQDGTLRGTLMYTGVTAPPVPIRARKITATALVDELGPYHSLVANQDVVTTATGTIKADSLNGTFEMRPVGGGNVILSGTFRSARVPS